NENMRAIQSIADEGYTKASPLLDVREERLLPRFSAKRMRLALQRAIEAGARFNDAVVDLYSEIENGIGLEVGDGVDRSVFAAVDQMCYGQRPPRRAVARANLQIRDYLRELSSA